MSLLKYFDIYDSKVNFKINGKKGFATELGGAFSLLTFFSIVSTIIFFGSDCYNRTNPHVFNQYYFPEQSEKTLITNENFNVAWRIEDGEARLFNFTKVFYPRIRYVLYERNKTTLELQGTFHYFSIKKCRNTTINPKYMKNINLNDWYCLDFSEFKVYMGGDWSKDFIGLIGFEILFCPNNDFKSMLCTDFSTLRQNLGVLDALYLSIIYPEVYVSNTDLIEPVKFQLKNYYNTINVNANKIDRLFLNKNRYVDDQGWIFQSKTEYSHISGYYFDKSLDYKTDEEFKINETSLLYTFNIFMDDKYIVYYRKFMKIQELAATVGGFMKVILLLFEILNFLPNSFLRNRAMTKEFYFFQKNNNRENGENIILRKLSLVEGVFKGNNFQSKTQHLKNNNIRNIKLRSPCHDLKKTREKELENSKKIYNNEINIRNKITDKAITGENFSQIKAQEKKMCKDVPASITGLNDINILSNSKLHKDEINLKTNTIEKTQDKERQMNIIRRYDLTDNKNHISNTHNSTKLPEKDIKKYLEPKHEDKKCKMVSKFNDNNKNKIDPYKNIGLNKTHISNKRKIKDLNKDIQKKQMKNISNNESNYPFNSLFLPESDIISVQKHSKMQLEDYFYKKLNAKDNEKNTKLKQKYFDIANDPERFRIDINVAAEAYKAMSERSKIFFKEKKPNMGMLSYYKNKICYNRRSSHNNDELFILFERAVQKIYRKIDIIYYLKFIYKLKKFFAVYKKSDI